jgi:phosphohistidine phosphatase SixA
MNNPSSFHRLLVLGIVTMAVAVGCQKEDPIIPLAVKDLNPKIEIIVPSGKLKWKANQKITWKATAGTLTQTDQDSLIYTGGSNVGFATLIIKSERNLQDSIKILIATTPRADIFKPLQKGGHVLMFRHTAADIGSDDLTSKIADWWKSCDSKIARQLNDQGKKDAADIGKTIKTLQIPVGRMVASEFCRTISTADLMKFDIPTQTSKDLTYYIYDEPNRYANSMKVATAQPIDDKNSVLVIHAGFTGTIPSPSPLSNLNWGDAAVFQLVTGQPPKYISTIAIKDLVDLAK